MEEMKRPFFKEVISSLRGFVLSCRDAVMGWWQSMHLSAGCSESKATDSGASDEENASAVNENTAGEETPVKKKGQPFLDILLSVPDIIAGLSLCSAIVVALRPQLLSADFQKLPESFSAVVDFGSCFFKAYIKPKLPEDVLRYRNFFVVLFLFLYVFWKVWVIAFFPGKTKKALSFLFIAMTLLACTLVADKFLVFLLFILLLFIGFQTSLGMTVSFALKKLGIIALLAVTGYIAFVFCADKTVMPAVTDMLDATQKIFSSLALPIQSWW